MLDRSPQCNAQPRPTGARRRVVVAMSGGVDSSVAAALMMREGHEVIGITLQLYDHGAATRRTGACCAGQDIHDARRAAEHLGIAHYVLDYESRFRSAVIDTFADSYVRGETPIPCVTCNQEVKFNDLLTTSRDLGADRLVTGHYIERREGPAGPALHRAADAARDQSYFLFATTPDQLARLDFPLGGLTKPQVRRLAEEFGLSIAAKPDSQDICFVAGGRYADVVAKLRPEAAMPGDIVHVDGRVIGRHEGVINFTVGQRKGLGVAAGEPLFVVRLEPQHARVVVGPRHALAVHALVLRDVNWLGDMPMLTTIGEARVKKSAAEKSGMDIHVRVRSTQATRPAELHCDPETGVVTVHLPGGEFGVARGQACVFYADGSDRARVLGGGFIAATERREAAAAA